MTNLSFTCGGWLAGSSEETPPPGFALQWYGSVNLAGPSPILLTVVTLHSCIKCCGNLKQLLENLIIWILDDQFTITMVDPRHVSVRSVTGPGSPHC